MTLRNYADYVNQISNAFVSNNAILSQSGATNPPVVGVVTMAAQLYFGPTFPAFPPTVTEYRITNISLNTNVAKPIVVAKLVPLLLYDLATSTKTVYAGMPTVTEGGISRQMYSGVLAVGDFTQTSGGPDTISVLYNDQNNNTSEWTTPVTLSASALLYSANFIKLNGNDIGAVNVTDISIVGTGVYTGALLLAGLVPIGMASFYLNSGGTGAQINLITHTPCPHAAYANDILVCLQLDNTAANTIIGSVNVVGVT